MILTEKLQIIPLKPEELDLYLQGENKLEKQFHLKDTARTVSEEVKERVTRIVLPKLRKMKGSDYLFSTFWIVIDRASLAIVAELGFKGTPDKQGIIEIGYGTLPSHRGKGIMTEAVAGMIRWAGSRTDICRILAETDQSNIASIRVLEKNKFVPFDLRGNMKWWKIEVSEL